MKHKPRDRLGINDNQESYRQLGKKHIKENEEIKMNNLRNNFIV
jgi:hypothetical protein